jgi:hypothetical protein
VVTFGGGKICSVGRLAVIYSLTKWDVGLSFDVSLESPSEARTSPDGRGRLCDRMGKSAD